MRAFEVIGGQKLKGSIVPQGAKNEALQIIKALWTQERASFEGKHYQVRGAWCEPKPDPLPTIMVGAFRPQMLRLIDGFATGGSFPDHFDGILILNQGPKAIAKKRISVADQNSDTSVRPYHKGFPYCCRLVSSGQFRRQR